MMPHLLTTGRGQSLTTLHQQLPDKTLIEMQQVHGANWAWIDQPTSEKVTGVDALLTQNPQLALIVRTADCVPILLFEKTSQTIGVIHAGRQGTELQITKKVLTALTQKVPQPQLQIWLGPHICEKCYQINQDTDEHYNLLEKNLSQIHQVLKPSAVEVTTHPDCTAHHNDRWYSYRREGKGVAMNYFAITLTE